MFTHVSETMPRRRRALRMLAAGLLGTWLLVLLFYQVRLGHEILSI
jgi:hypothetical protein